MTGYNNHRSESSEARPPHPEHEQGRLHVLIIGGGIGGLCLAQGLTRSGISVAVYERDESVQFRGQGYRISLKADSGVQALRDCLPENLFELCAATSIRPATLMVFLDQQLNQAFAKPLPPGGPTNSGFGVNRLTLREILLAGLTDKVHFGKTFKRFDETDDGRVVAHFTDGSSAAGTLLVGADGTKSAVRARVAPDAVIDDLGHAIYGKTPITPGMLAWVPEVLIDSFNRITGPEGFGVSVATCRAAEPVADAAARLAPGVRLTEIPGYFSWTLSLTDGGFRGADAPTLHRLAVTLVRECHPAVRRIIDEADVPATFPVTIGSARPIAPWQTRSVTLLGDAIHTMSPGRGDGANIALRDAALLREALADVAANRATLAEIKTRYETAMLRYGFEAVAASRDNPFLRRSPIARSAR